MLKTLTFRRFLAVSAAAFAAALALDAGRAEASSISFRDGQLEYAVSQVGVTCFGRVVEYRADTFVTAQYGSYRTPVAAFRIEYDLWNGAGWVYGGRALDWRSASIGGQFALNLPAGRFFQLRTQFAYLHGNVWNYMDWQVEIFNGGGLPFCKV